MKNKKKKILMGIGGFFLLLIIIVIALPFLFKDKINQYAKTEINKRLNATVDYKDFGLSMIRNFPHFTFSLDELKVIGKNEFARDTLVQLSQFRITLNIWSVLGGNQMEVNKIALINPKISAKVLRDGKANWDIVKPDSVVKEETPADTSKPFALKLDKYSIENGEIHYLDKSTNTRADIINLNHSGSGNFQDDLIGFYTRTDCQSLYVNYAGTTYLNKVALDATVNIDMDTKNSKYTFKDNAIKINDFGMSFDGFLQMATADIVMDVKCKTTDTQFKNIYSLIPGVYTKDFDNIKTDGTLAFDAYAKGTYNEKTMPAFGLNLLVKNGFFQYPSLPAAAKNIQVDLKVDNPGPDLEQIAINLKNFSADLAGQPIQASLTSKGLTSMNINALAKAKIDLAVMSKLFPVDKTELKGIFSLDAQANGVYSTNSLPQVQATMNMQNGYVKSGAFPEAIENLNFDASAANPSGKYEDTNVEIKKLHAELDKQPIDAVVSIKNLNDVDFDVYCNGKLDLAKLMKIYPMAGMKLSGIIDIQELKTKGKQSDALAGRYDKIPTSGKIDISQFQYVSEGLPPVSIDDAKTEFTPKTIKVSKYTGKLGKSPIEMSGEIGNYLAYVMNGETVSGSWKFYSPRFDVNEWMAPSDAPAAPAATKPDSVATAMEAVAVPANINFLLDSKIDEVIYDTWNIKQLEGKIRIKDQKVALEGTKFDLMGGKFIANGAYDSKDIKKPLVNFDMQIDQMKIQEAFQSFSSVKAFMPIAKDISGIFNAKFNYSSLLKQDMMPDLTTVSVKGLTQLVQAGASKIPLLNTISEFTKMDDVKEINIANTSFKFKIENGRVNIEPFTMKHKDMVINMEGSHGIDQTLDYKMKLDVPSGKIGQAANQIFSQYGQKNLSAPDRIKLDLGIGGTLMNPKITGAGGKTVNEVVKEKVKEKVEEVKEKVKDEVDKKKQELEEKARKEAEKAKADARAKADAILKEAETQSARIRSEGRTAAEKVKQEGYAAAKRIEDEAKNPIAKIAAKKAADKLRKEADDKSNKLIQEADKKADDVMNQAKQKADALLK